LHGIKIRQDLVVMLMVVRAGSKKQRETRSRGREKKDGKTSGRERERGGGRERDGQRRKEKSS
jgi:hypothetical protein